MRSWPRKKNAVVLRGFLRLGCILQKQVYGWRGAVQNNEIQRRCNEAKNEQYV
jgi:hypothetical protein